MMELALTAAAASICLRGNVPLFSLAPHFPIIQHPVRTQSGAPRSSAIQLSELPTPAGLHFGPQKGVPLDGGHGKLRGVASLAPWVVAVP